MSAPATVIFTLASLLNPNDSIEMAEAERLNERVVHRALLLKGPHRRARYRLRKIDFLIAEQGDAISVMRAIKKALDPDNIMDPGKMLRV
jgi:D-lactate dehydrogenase (cytochrome)